MENARCENLGLARHHSGAQHNTEHLSSFVAETEKWKKHARCGNVFIAHCHGCTANTCIVMVTCFAAVSAQVHVHVTPWYSAQVTFSCLPCFAKKIRIFWLITGHNRSVVTNTGLWIVTLKCVSLASCWWLVAGGLTAKWQNYSQLFTNCPFLSEASICNYTLDWQTNSGTSM